MISYFYLDLDFLKKINLKKIEWKYWCVSSLVEMKYVNKLLRLCKEIIKKPIFDPLISTPGVNNNINTVNMSKIPLYFHSRHGFSIPEGAKLKDMC